MESTNIYRKWFNSLSDKEQLIIIERAYIVGQKVEPIGYSETYDYILKAKKERGNVVNIGRLNGITKHLGIPNMNEEDCVYHFAKEFGCSIEKTYAHSSNGGNWNGWKIYFK